MSGLGKLNTADWLKALLVGGLSAGAGVGLSALTGGADIRTVGVAAGAGFLAYIVKNLGTTQQGAAFGIKATEPKPNPPAN